MEITKNGNQYEEPSEWTWYFRCTNCGCEFNINKSEGYGYDDKKKPGKCPQCRQRTAVRV